MPSDDSDDRLLARLSAVARVCDPPPADVVRSARAAYVLAMLERVAADVRTLPSDPDR